MGAGQFVELRRTLVAPAACAYARLIGAKCVRHAGDGSLVTSSRAPAIGRCENGCLVYQRRAVLGDACSSPIARLIHSRANAVKARALTVPIIKAATTIVNNRSASACKAQALRLPITATIRGIVVNQSMPFNHRPIV